jgi:predicted RNA binding protein YcfA (HicA-like mRNA interferase family)
MGRLANVSSADFERVARTLGWELSRQSGSHRIFARANDYRRLVVPLKRELATGTLRSLIRDMGITVDDFLRLL